MAVRSDIFFGGAGVGPDTFTDRYWIWGSGTPEGTIEGVVGCFYIDTDTGILYSKTGTGTTGWALINNLETPSAVVRYGQWLKPPTLQPGDNESTALYFRIEPSSQQYYGFYGELFNQVDTFGGIGKILHYGSGDAIYLALIGDGTTATAGPVAIESASFCFNARGFIATNQRNRSPAPYNGIGDFFFNTHFASVWGDDGTGGSTVYAAYGPYFADRTLGSTFRIRVQNPAATITDGQPLYPRQEIILQEWGDPGSPFVPGTGAGAAGRNRIEVWNDGSITLRGPDNAGTPVRTTEPHLKIAAQNAGVEKSLYWWNTGAAAPGPELQLYGGNEGTETLYARIGQSGIKTQIGPVAYANAAYGGGVVQMQIAHPGAGGGVFGYDWNATHGGSIVGISCVGLVTGAVQTVTAYVNGIATLLFAQIAAAGPGFARSVLPTGSIPFAAGDNLAIYYQSAAAAGVLLSASLVVELAG